MTTDLTTLLAEADAVSAAATPDRRPENCRFRRRDEQKPYPRSSCYGCGRTITTGLGKSCAVADEHIAASRDLIPRLVAACRDQMAEIERLRGAIPVTQAESDILRERSRQVSEEGWTAEHDDLHSRGEIARAAAAYAYEAGRTDQQREESAGEAPLVWPWDDSWWKSSDRRCDLVKAGALIIAEIERLDRAALQPAGKDTL